MRNESNGIRRQRGHDRVVKNGIRSNATLFNNGIRKSVIGLFFW
ncbi:MAG: hypothetical protein WCR45_12020 [Bacteroidaceae bacterium]